MKTYWLNILLILSLAFPSGATDYPAYTWPNGYGYTPSLTTEGVTNWIGTNQSQGRIDTILGQIASKGGVGTITTAASIYPSSNGTNPGTKVQYFTVTALAGTGTFYAPTGSWNTGDKLIIEILDNGTARTLDFTTSAVYVAGDLPLPTVTIQSKTMYLSFIYNSVVSKWRFVGTIGNF